MPLPEATLTAAEARLDACIAANDALCTRLERMGQLPIPGADAALDDLYDLVMIVRAKLRRAWTLVDNAIDPIRAANDDLPDAA
jgi:hypothetical protein